MADIQPTTSTTEISHTAPSASSGSPAAERGRQADRPVRPVEVTTIKHGSVIATPVRPEGREVVAVRSSSEPKARSFTEHQRQMLDNLDKHGDVNGASAAESTTLATTTGATPAVTSAAAAPADAKTAAATPDAPAAAVAPAPSAPAIAATPAADPELAARVDRLVEHNKRLVAELDRRSAAAATPDERTRALDEIERGLTTDTLASVRKLLALNAGIKDAADPAVDRLLGGLYAELTANELKMPMDAGQRALMEAERTRRLVERDKKDALAAESAKQVKEAESAENERNANVGMQLSQHLESSKHAEQFPLLMRHAATIDKVSPGELVWAAIRHGIRAGESSKDDSDETLINRYSKKIETFYQDHLAKLGITRPEVASTSTAAPAQATVPATENKADASNNGVRTITNASASVAPPAPPAQPTSQPTDKTVPKKWRNEDERRQQLAKHHFGSD